MHINVKCGKNISRENIKSQNTCKWSISIFWFLVKDIKIPVIFYKIQKFVRTSWALIITHKDLLNLIIWMYTTPLVKKHLRFKQAQPKMCHSPKVEDGIKNKSFNSLTHISGHFLKELFTAIEPKSLELVTYFQHWEQGLSISY